MAEKDGKVLGSVAIVRFNDEVAQLRWLILAPEARGLGLGRDLVNLAVDFARGSGYRSVFLWTLEFLTAAKALYESDGVCHDRDQGLRQALGPGQRSPRNATTWSFRPFG